MTIATTDVNVKELDESLASVRAKVLSGERTLADLQWFDALPREKLDELMEADEEEVDESEQAPTSILRCISEGTEIVIEATEGKRTISGAKQTFPGGIYGDLKGLGADKAGGARPATPVKVHEMVEDATFAKMFGSLVAEKKNLCFTHDQIITFCEKHHKWLRKDGYATFFLYEFEGNFSVADVYFFDDGRLGVDVHPFENGGVWRAGFRHRLVVPQL